jgi:hypothetical protein
MKKKNISHKNILATAGIEIDVPVPPVELSILDKIGQKIQRGSIIIYGHALGRSAALKIGKVMGIIPKELTETKRVWRNNQAVWEDTPFTAFRISVIGLEYLDNEEDFNPALIPTVGKKSTLYYSSRVVGIDPACFPKSIKDVLDTIK